MTGLIYHVTKPCDSSSSSSSSVLVFHGRKVVVQPLKRSTTDHSLAEPEMDRNLRTKRSKTLTFQANCLREFGSRERESWNRQRELVPFSGPLGTFTARRTDRVRHATRRIGEMYIDMTTLSFLYVFPSFSVKNDSLRPSV